MKNRLVQYSIIVLITFVLLEASLRIFYSFDKESIFSLSLFHQDTSFFSRFTVKESIMVEADTELGWRAKAGAHQFAWKVGPEKYRATINISTAGERLFSIHDRLQYPARPAIVFIGGSITQGLGLNDNDIFASRVALANRHLGTANIAVAGYGTHQAFLRLKQYRWAQPGLVIYTLIEHHEQRNVNTMFMRLTRVLSRNCRLKIPIVSLTDSMLVETYSKPDACDEFSFWQNLPVKSIALGYFVMAHLNDERAAYAHHATREVIKGLNDWLKKRNSRLLISFLQADTFEKYQAFLSEQQIDSVSQKKPLANLPYDRLHPDAASHRQIAATLNRYLKNAD